MRSFGVLSKSASFFTNPLLRTSQQHCSSFIEYAARSRGLPIPKQPTRSLHSRSPPSHYFNKSRRSFTTSPFRSSEKAPPSGKGYDPTPNLGSPDASLSLSQRLRKLSREYGWSAVGVYLAFSALDFPFCFLAVRWLGADRIGAWEHVAVEWIRKAIPFQIPPSWRQGSQDMARAIGLDSGGEVLAGENIGYDHGVKEAERENKGENASIWTQLALAYAIHKSFIFLRVPLTAAVTPKVVKVLRGWGWNIGKRRPKDERIAAKVAKAVTKGS